MLYRFHTGIAYGKDSFFYRLCSFLPSKLYHKISNRFIDDVPDRYLERHVLIELKALLYIRLGRPEEDVLYNRNKHFQLGIPDADINMSDVVIGFDTSSWILADNCNRSGKRFILDVSIGHPLSKEKIYRQLADMYGEWKEQVLPKRKEFIDLECREMELARNVVVPSQFVKNTLIENQIPADKIRVNPFGTFIEEFRINPDKDAETDGIKFLFLGSFMARKGLPLLLEAWNEMSVSGAELIIAGYGKLPAGISLPPTVTNLGTIAKDDRLNIFDKTHVFLFPSFFEGLAQVQIEAMACGLPVVGTYNSGAEELVEDSVNGFIIKAGDKQGLKDAIRFFLDNPGKIKEMGFMARKKAERFSWENYGAGWEQIIKHIG